MRKALVAVLALPFSIACATAQTNLQYTSSGGEDSAAINALIGSSAAQASNKTITIYGPIRIGGPVRIPAGTKNLSIVGSGPNGRCVVNILNWTSIFEVGRADFKVTQAMPLSGLTAQAIRPATAGSNLLTVGSGGSRKGNKSTTSTPLQLGWHVVYDNKSVTHKTVASTIFYSAMLVKVTGSNTSGQSVLDTGLNRNYDSTPQVAFLGSNVTENISISNFEADGLIPGSTVSINGFVNAGFTVGLRVSNLYARRFSSGIVKVGLSRNFHLDGLDMADSAGNLAAGGEGYGAYVLRSSNGLITNSRAATMRHGFVMHSGTTDVTIQDSVGLSTVGSDFDTHGMDEQRLTFRRVSGVSIGIGNDAWVKGGAGHVVEDSTVNFIYIGPDTSGTVRGSRIGRSDISGGLMLSARYGIMPNNWLVQDTSFVGTNRLVKHYGDMQVRDLVFERCTWQHTGAVMESYGIGGNITFLANSFSGGSGWTNGILHLESNSSLIPLNVVVRDTTFVSPTASTAVVFNKNPWTGSGTVTGSKLQGLKAAVLAYGIDPSMNLVQQNNTVLKQ